MLRLEGDEPRDGDVLLDLLPVKHVGNGNQVVLVHPVDVPDLRQVGRRQVLRVRRDIAAVDPVEGLLPLDLRERLAVLEIGRVSPGGSLVRLLRGKFVQADDVDFLEVIADRSESLSRFLMAYGRLARLPTGDRIAELAAEMGK